MDLLELEILPEVSAYEAETVPILRCPSCHWMWALLGGADLRRSS